MTLSMAFFVSFEWRTEKFKCSLYSTHPLVSMSVKNGATSDSPFPSENGNGVNPVNLLNVK